MNITYYGHSCFAVDFGGKRLLFDPFITPNDLASAVDIETIAADYILISHAHFDHVADGVAIAQRTGAMVISNYEVVEWFSRQGVTNGHGMNLGGGFNFDFGRVKLTNAVHSSSFPDGTYGGHAGGFVVSGPAGTLYYSGDTALTMDMQLVAEEFRVDLAVLPVGDNFTMGANDAARAATMLGCTNVLGVHYDTFPPIRIDHDAARETFAASGLHLHLLPIGESREL